MKTNLKAKAFVFNDAGEVLLLRRSNTAPSRAMTWDLPGGLVEDGEAFEAAVIRRSMVETGLPLTPEDTQLVYATTIIDGFTNVVMMFFASHSQSTNVILSNEHDKYEWAALEHAIATVETPSIRDAAQHISDNRLMHGAETIDILSSPAAEDVQSDAEGDNVLPGTE